MTEFLSDEPFDYQSLRRWVSRGIRHNFRSFVMLVVLHVLALGGIVWYASHETGTPIKTITRPVKLLQRQDGTVVRPRKR